MKILRWLVGALAAVWFLIFLTLDPAKREVRAMDHEYALEWSAGMPILGAARVISAGVMAEGFIGTEHKMERQIAFRVQDVFNTLGKLILRGTWVPPKPVYEYKFDTAEIKGPLHKAIAGCGWTCR